MKMLKLTPAEGLFVLETLLAVRDKEFDANDLTEVVEQAIEIVESANNKQEEEEIPDGNTIQIPDGENTSRFLD